MHLTETIVSTTSITSNNTTTGSLSVHNLSTGAHLATFKHTNAPRHCTAYVESREGRGGYVMCAQDKGVLGVWGFQRDQVALRMVLPEKLTCIALDAEGMFCAGGSAQGRIYLWEVASGILFNSWDAHYRQVNVLKFTRDGTTLVSGSDDSGLSVWTLSSLLDDELQNEPPRAYCTLSDHTLPVTDIVCGVGAFPRCRILTASLDHTVKLWDVSTESLLTTFQFSHAVDCIAWDPTERLFFAALGNGTVRQVDLFRTSDEGSRFEAVGGMGVGDVVRVEEMAKGKGKAISVGCTITSLALSLTTTQLLIGTSTGKIQVHTLPTLQLIRTLHPSPQNQSSDAQKSQGPAITFLATMIKPVDLVGHVDASLDLGISIGSSSGSGSSGGGVGGAGAGGDIRDVFPMRSVVPFARIRDVKAREAHEVLMTLRPCEEHATPTPSYPLADLISDHAYFMSSLSSSSPSTLGDGTLAVHTDSLNMQSKISSLEAEVASLREQLGKAKGVNDAMWERVVQRVVREETG